RDLSTSRKSAGNIGNLNSLSRILRSLLWGVLFGWGIWLLRRWLASAMTRESRNASPSPITAAPITLYRDPVCGTHVAPDAAFPLVRAGRREFFCSAECRETYLRTERHAASA